MPTTQPTVVLGDLRFPEGGRWRDGTLWFSDMHGHAVLRSTVDGDITLAAEVAHDEPSGLGWLPDGRLLVFASPGSPGDSASSR